MKAANRDFTRELNLFNILNSIREAGSISRVEIAEKTGQSRASVTNITALLIEQGLIYEDQVESSPSRGRRRIMLMLNPEAAYAIGIKISAFRLSFAVVDFDKGNIKYVRIFDHDEAHLNLRGTPPPPIRKCAWDADLGVVITDGHSNMLFIADAGSGKVIKKRKLNIKEGGQLLD